jgi:hypothetical protein
MVQPVLRLAQARSLALAHPHTREQHAKLKSTSVKALRVRTEQRASTSLTSFRAPVPSASSGRSVKTVGGPVLTVFHLFARLNIASDKPHGDLSAFSLSQKPRVKRIICS